MANVIQNLREAVGRLNRDRLIEAYPIWKGRTIELLTNLSTHLTTLPVHMRQSMSNPYIAVATANTLYYVLFSCPVVCFFQNHSDQADATDQAVIRQEGLNQVKTVVILGTLTALFNVGFSRLSQQQLNRETLFSVTAIVLAIHLLFRTLLASLNAMGRSSSALRLPPWIDQPRLSRSLYAELLEHTSFTEENFQALILGLDIQEDTLFDCFTTFIKEITINNLPKTPELRKQLIQSIVDEFKEKFEGRLVNAGEAKKLFEVVLENHQIRLLGSQSSAASSASNSAIRAVGVAQTDLSRDETYRALIGMGFDSGQLSTVVRFTAQGGQDILRSLLSKIRDSNVLPALAESKALFLACMISMIKMTNPLAINLITFVNGQTDKTIDRLLTADGRRNEPAYARLLILGFEHNKLQEFDAESINVIDQFFQQQLPFIEHFTTQVGLNHDSFLQNVKEASAIDASGNAFPPQDRLLLVKSYLKHVYSITRLHHFGFKISDFTCLRLHQEFEITENEGVSIVDQCLLPHYGKRKVLPQSDEEKEDFFKYISTQLHRSRPHGQPLDRDGIVNLLQPIVDHAIAHPEIYRSHELYPGEPGYEHQQKHGRGLNQPLIDAEPESEY